MEKFVSTNLKISQVLFFQNFISPKKDPHPAQNKNTRSFLCVFVEIGLRNALKFLDFSAMSIFRNT
jgi:hypothetical protein